MVPRALRNHSVRFAVGIAISCGFAALTLASVDIEALSRTWANAALPLVAVGVLVSALEVGVRAARWRLLLRPLSDPGFVRAYALLSVGHLANALLPARLGDVARALITGSRLGISRTSVLGTVAVERVADAGLLALAAIAGAVVGLQSFGALLPAVALAAVVGLVVAGVVVGVLNVRAVADSRVGAVLLYHGRRFAAGAASLRSFTQVARLTALTLISFGLAVALLLVAAASVGISLSPWEASLVMALLTLSTAIPAGPASVGTYEFVGTAILASMGYRPEPSLLAVALVHAIAVMTPATIGLLSMWSMGISPVATRLGTRAVAQ